jgi:hypothetical protein
MKHAGGSALLVALALCEGACIVACSNAGEEADAGHGTVNDAGADRASDAHSDSSVVLAVQNVEDLGAFTAPPTVVGRDGTTSALVGGSLIWTFGDTFLTKPNSIDGTTVLSATAGWSTVNDPLRLDEPTDDAGLPYQLIPYTAEEIAKNKVDPQNGYALWPGPVVARSETEAVIFYQQVIRMNGSNFAADAVGTAIVTKGSTRAVRNTGFLFEGKDPLFSNGGATIDGDTIYLYDCEFTLGFQCRVARAAIADATKRSAYEFWNGSSWTAEVAQAAWFIKNANAAISVEDNPWVGRWLAVESDTATNGVALRTADALIGPWDMGVVVPGTTSGLVTSDAGLNYLAKEHVELRSKSGQQIVVGYAHPLPNFGGAPRLARFTLK